MKTCNHCNETKEFNQFSKGNSNKDGYSGQCKECKAKLTREYVKTILGKLTQIYNSQKKASKDRGHPPPNYSKKELIEYALSKTDFISLFNSWVSSNYDKNLSPSFDRLEDNLPYAFTNLRLVSWKENSEKAYLNRLSCKTITKQNKKIGKYSMEDVLLETYDSIAKAARDNNVIRTNLNQAVKHNIPRYGYIWKYL
jgi:hypothetical protein